MRTARLLLWHSLGTVSCALPVMHSVVSASTCSGTVFLTRHYCIVCTASHALHHSRWLLLWHCVPHSLLYRLHWHYYTLSLARTLALAQAMHCTPGLALTCTPLAFWLLSTRLAAAVRSPFNE